VCYNRETIRSKSQDPFPDEVPMNYLAHALPFLDRPYVAAGTGVPDWLTVVDRRVRVRSKQAQPLVDGCGTPLAAVAGGIVQHIRDDARFHESQAFFELSLELTVRARDAVGPDSGFRPSFLGHLLVEVLLDATLTAEKPDRLEAYYQALDQVDAHVVQDAVNRMAGRPTDRLATLIRAFRRDRILWDYLDDGKLLKRLDRVMRRVNFAPLPDSFVDLLPDARRLVDRRKDDLLHEIPTSG